MGLAPKFHVEADIKDICVVVIQESDYSTCSCFFKDERRKEGNHGNVPSKNTDLKQISKA